MKKILIQEKTYFDSIQLMNLNEKVLNIEGVEEAYLLMGTTANKDFLQQLDYTLPLAKDITASDLIIAFKLTKNIDLDLILAKIKKSFQVRTKKEQDFQVSTVKEGVKLLANPNLAIISLRGDYVYAQAIKALNLNLHTMIFSDNVALTQELKLKQLASEKGLLLMGPDCGTSIINGTPLGFANQIRQGSIGIVAASGTGAQEISSIIHRHGGGISHLIGVGGRDLETAIGGISFLTALKALNKDEKTKIIILIAKKIDQEILNKLEQDLIEIKKPLIVIFVGANIKLELPNLQQAATLKEAAWKALSYLSQQNSYQDFIPAVSKKFNFADSQIYIKGYYSGGTLCTEAEFLLKQNIVDFELDTNHDGHSFVDFGSDQFTSNLAHPMMDYQTRLAAIKKVSDDPQTAIVLLDIVLGYNAHPNPQKALIPILNQARKNAANQKRELVFIIALVGTAEDIQDYQLQYQSLQDADFLVTQNNQDAVELALSIWKKFIKK